MRRRIAVLLLLLGLFSCALAEDGAFVYGTSEMGRELTCVRIGEESAEKALLMTFAVHGFEDAFDHDGQVLTEIAQKLIEHYQADASGLNGHALYIVPCANPDGVLDGESKDGFGRLNANGIDVNRDFPAQWKRITTARYRTGEKPFATAEARALRDLAEQICPAWAVDVHGWINGVYGDSALSKSFQQAFGFAHRRYQSGGKLSQWLAERTEAAVLVELPSGPSRAGYAEKCAQKLIRALDLWFSGV